MTFDRAAFDQVLTNVEELSLISALEHQEILSVLDSGFPYASALGLTDSVHAHIKVADVNELPHGQFAALGYRPENAEPGYIKYSTDAAINLIFSCIPISVDDQIPGAVGPERPFMDHVGIDMRNESAETMAMFDAIPAHAAELGWREVPQGGDQSVHCCHTQVKAKHWVYPPSHWQGWRRPIEFAFGTLVIFDKKMGCDLRPIDPDHPMAQSPASSCCAPAGQEAAESSCCGVPTGQGQATVASSCCDVPAGQGQATAESSCCDAPAGQGQASCCDVPAGQGQATAESSCCDAPTGQGQASCCDVPTGQGQASCCDASTGQGQASCCDVPAGQGQATVASVCCDVPAGQGQATIASVCCCVPAEQEQATVASSCCDSSCCDIPAGQEQVTAESVCCCVPAVPEQAAAESVCCCVPAVPELVAAASAV